MEKTKPDLRELAGECDPPQSEAVYRYDIDPERGVRGMLVVDSRVGGMTGGGIRMVPEVPAVELAHLARAMTCKAGFLNLPIGGAKAAVSTGPGPVTQADRARFLFRFGELLADQGGTYLPGKDIGTDDDDLAHAYAALGLSVYDTPTDSAYYTALGLTVCIEEMARRHWGGLAGRRFAVEGLGKVGSWTAAMLERRGARLVAASTLAGAVADPDGLDLSCLLDLRRDRGDDWVQAFDASRRIPRGELLLQSVDLLVPCAGSWSINLGNASALQAKMIVSGANCPVTDRAREVLDDRGVPCPPFFVSNGGGVLGATLERFKVERPRINRFFDRQYRDRIADLLDRATGPAGLTAAARELARANSERMTSAGGARGAGLRSRAVRLVRQERPPAGLLRIAGPVWLAHRLRAGMG